MGLLNIVRLIPKIANKVTRDLQPVVMYARKTSNGAYGPVFAAAIPLHAIVDYKTTQVRTKDGTLTATRSVLTLLDINEVVAATSGLGIDNDDVFTLPDGDTGPILDIDGFVDAGTGHPIATTVMLG